MKRSLLLLSLFVFAFGMTGCVKARMETNINADGSGTFSMNASVTESVAEALKEMEEIGGMDGMDAPSMDIKKDELEAACKKHGVTIKKFEESTPGGAQMIDMILEFKNLEGLSAVLDATMDNEGGMKLFKTADGNYVLRGSKDMGGGDDDEDMASDDADDDDDSDSPDEMDPAKMGKAMEIMGKLMSSMQELDVAMRITVPGDIIESNAPKTDGRTSIWEINSENMMTAGDSMGEPEIVFSGKGVKIDAPADED